MWRFVSLILASLAALHAACVAGQSDTAPAIDPPVRVAIEAGSARVTLELEMAQGQSIAAVQDEVLARLAGTEFELLRRPSGMAFLTLNIGPDALERLERMGDMVRRVYPDTRLSPQAPSGAPEG